jgi:hypothetical protein
MRGSNPISPTPIPTPLARAIAANKATAHLQSGASGASTSLHFQYAMLGFVHVNGQASPAPMNPLSIAVRPGFLRRDIYVAVPSYLYKVPNAPSLPSSNEFKLNFLRTNQIIESLPMDLSGETKNIFIGSGSPTSSVQGKFSVAYGEPTCNLYNPYVATLVATPPTSASNLLCTILDNSSHLFNLYVPRTIQLDLDIDQLTVTCDAVDQPDADTIPFGKCVAFLACLSSPTIGLTEGTPT